MDLGCFCLVLFGLRWVGNWVKVMLLLVLLILVLNLTENVMWGGVILCRFFYLD